MFQEALRKLFRFVSTSIMETRVAGRFASDLCRAAAKVHPEKAVKMFVSHFTANIKSRLSSKYTTFIMSYRPLPLEAFYELFITWCYVQGQYALCIFLWPISRYLIQIQ